MECKDHEHKSTTATIQIVHRPVHTPTRSTKGDELVPQPSVIAEQKHEGHLAHVSHHARDFRGTV